MKFILLLLLLIPINSYSKEFYIMDINGGVLEFEEFSYNREQLFYQKKTKLVNYLSKKGKKISCFSLYPPSMGDIKKRLNNDNNPCQYIYQPYSIGFDYVILWVSEFILRNDEEKNYLNYLFFNSLIEYPIMKFINIKDYIKTKGLDNKYIFFTTTKEKNYKIYFKIIDDLKIRNYTIYIKNEHKLKTIEKDNHNIILFNEYKDVIDRLFKAI